MKTRIIIYVLLFGVAGFGALFLGRAMSGPVDSAQAAVTTQYLAVAKPLEAGSFIESKDLEWRDWHGSMHAEAASRYFTKGSIDTEQLVGAVLRRPLQEGDFLVSQDFFTPGESAFLAAVLKAGSRAIAIPVDDVTGGAGLIRPGNKVDVILSGRLEQDATGLPAAQTLLRDVRIIAVNRDTGVPASAAQKAASSASTHRANSTKGTVTLEVTPKEVELLTVAKGVGTLSLSLRSLVDAQDVALSERHLTRASELVHSEKKAAPPAAPRQVVTLYGANEKQ